MPTESPYATSYLLPIAMFALSVTVCEITAYELPFVLDSNLNLNEVKDVDDLDEYR